jgi:glycine/serine hydroxymethyltransferase
MPIIVDLIDRVIADYTNEKVIEKVRAEVNEMMTPFPLFSY